MAEIKNYEILKGNIFINFSKKKFTMWRFVDLVAVSMQKCLDLQLYKCFFAFLACIFHILIWFLLESGIISLNTDQN